MICQEDIGASKGWIVPSSNLWDHVYWQKENAKFIWSCFMYFLINSKKYNLAMKYQDKWSSMNIHRELILWPHQNWFFINHWKMKLYLSSCFMCFLINSKKYNLAMNIRTNETWWIYIENWFYGHTKIDFL